MKNWDSIILFDSSCNINDLTSDKIENSLIITFDYNSHRNLEKLGINHVISDSYLDQHFLSSIGKICYGLSHWYTQKPIEEIVEYDGLNLGEFFYIELYELLIPFLKFFSETFSNLRYFDLLMRICELLEPNLKGISICV